MQALAFPLPLPKTVPNRSVEVDEISARKNDDRSVNVRTTGLSSSSSSPSHFVFTGFLIAFGGGLAAVVASSSDASRWQYM